MEVSKVQLNGDTLLSVTDTTATASRIFYPYGAYGADGAWMDGTYSGGSIARYNITSTDNLDGTQTLDIEDAVDGAYFIVFDVDSDGTQRLYITDAGGGSSEPNLESKSVSYTPTETAQSETVSPSTGYDGLSSVSVSVGAISSTYVGSGITRNSKSDISTVVLDSVILGTKRKSNSESIPAGYYESSVATDGFDEMVVGSATSVALDSSGNATVTFSPTSHGFAYEVETYTLTKSGVVTPRSSSDLTASGATVTVPSGYYSSQATKSVANGTVTAPASISGTSATVSTGTNTLTLTKTVSVTPSVTTAGYVSSGTAGNSSVSLTASVTTKAAATITPTKSTQTIASGTYLTGTQTIAAIPAAYQDVTGVTAAAGDVVSGKSIVDSSGNTVNGSLVIQHYYTGSGTPSSSTGVNGDIYLKTS